MSNGRTQRIRDPIHGLIVFRADNEVDQLAWRLINTREFQRLRRIRQLGFSEFVFPGATHSRFSHCIGVFHTARELINVIRREVGDTDYNRDRARVAILAALLHDLGHGPFSHAFEHVEKALREPKKHEAWTAEIIEGTTEIHEKLAAADESLPREIAILLKQKDPTDIYASVVSSQFDADRLDYLRRDRYMTGTGSGGIDFEWLLDCLRVGEITIKPPDSDDYIQVHGLHLSHKGLRAAEEYLLARFNLYQQVYMHKTTRAAEKMLSALLGRVVNLIKLDQLSATGLPDKHSLLNYFSGDRSLQSYLSLDDSVVASSLAIMASSDDDMVRRLASALMDRRLYKCFDAGDRVREPGSDVLLRYRRAVRKRAAEVGLAFGDTLLDDDATVTTYGVYGFDERGAFQKVLIRRSEGSDPEDISAVSQVLKGVEPRMLYRVYGPDSDSEEKLKQLWRDIGG